MPNPHFNISITQRSRGQSAVAGAAYQSGDKLFSEYDQKYKDYSRKQGIVYTEIMLPPNAPPEFADRETLWNAVEENEKQWNSQLARRFVLTFPREVPPEYYLPMVKDYCNEFFVSKGMCCDFAIHDPDPPGHNPHCHVMLTMRAMDENGRWLPKARKVYELDENGERIRLPSGNWKCHKESTVDWNEQTYCEQWRQGWEVIQNRYLEMADRPERVDLRSYERQGLDNVPTVHMGPAVTQMERRGIATNIGNLNRDIKAANSLLRTVRKTIRDLLDWIAEARKSNKSEEISSPVLSDLLNKYLSFRSNERGNWSSYGKQKGATDDLKAVSQAIIYLNSKGLVTLDDLDNALRELNEKAKPISTEMKKAERRMQVISGIQKAVSDCNKTKATHDKYLKIGWKARQAAFAESHKDELDKFNKAYRYLKKQGVDLNVNLDALQAEYNKLKSSHADLSGQLAAVNEELKPMKDIRRWVGKVLSPEQSEVENKPEPKQSIAGKMRYYQGKEKGQAQGEAKTLEQEVL